MSKKSTMLLSLILFIFCIQVKSSIVSTEITSMSNKPLENVHGLVLMTDGAEHSEYTYPIEFLTEFGCKISIVAPENSVTTSNGVVLETDFLIDDMNNVSEYDFFFVPGGSSAGKLLDIPESIDLTVEVFESGLIMVAICAGPIVFVAADIISGYNISGNAVISADVVNAGGNFVPDEIVIDGPFVTADFPFMYTLAQQGILKALGFYETEPPEIIKYTIGSVATGETESITIIVELRDEFATKKVTAKISLVLDNQSQYEYTKVELYKNNPIFSTIIDEVPVGNYSLKIIAEDVLGNIGIYELEESICINSVLSLATTHQFLLLCTSILMLIFIVKAKRRKVN